jgi:DNA-binding NtrC family response regulator
VSASALSRRDRARLRAYAWPGNVRELRNVIEQSVALSEGGALELFGLDDDEASTARRPRGPTEDAPAPNGGALYSPGDAALFGRPFKEARASALAVFERMYVEQLLEKTEGNVSRAASTAEIDRNYLYRLMRRHGVGRPKE